MQITWNPGPAGSLIEIDQKIRRGFPLDLALQLKDRLQIPDRDLARLLGISPRSLARLKKTGQPLSFTASDRLYRALRLVELAYQVFNKPENAEHWLKRPQVALGGRIPLDLMQTEAGAHAVEALLGRMEYSVYT